MNMNEWRPCSFVLWQLLEQSGRKQIHSNLIKAVWVDVCNAEPALLIRVYENSLV